MYSERIPTEDLPGGKAVSQRVFDVDDVERSWMSLAVGHGTHSTQVVTARDHAHVACNGKRLDVSEVY